MAVKYTQAYVDALLDTMTKNPGVLEIRFGDQLYKFSTLQEMRDHVREVQRIVDAASRTSTGAVRYAATCKGV